MALDFRRQLRNPWYLQTRDAPSDSSSNDGSISVSTLVFIIVIGTMLLMTLVICIIRKRRRRRAQREARRRHRSYRNGQRIDPEMMQAIRCKVTRTIFPPGITAADLEKGKPTTSDATCDDQDGSASFTACSSDDDDSDNVDTTTTTVTCCDGNHVTPCDLEQQYDPESNSVAVESSADVVIIICSSAAEEENNLQHDDNDDEKRECAICLGDFNENDDEVAQMTKCTHLFHRDCILEWSQRRSDCPICRKEMWEPSRFDRLEKEIAKELLALKSSESSAPPV